MLGTAVLLVLAFAGSSSGWLFDRKVCYGDLGCFDTQTIRTFSRPIVFLPDSPEKIGTKFFLYTRTNADKSQEQELNRSVPSSFKNSAFDASRPTKIIIHGFTHSAHNPWVQKMKQELLKKSDVNVIAVDWRAGAVFPYTQAVGNIRVVAAQLAKLLEYTMRENPAMTPEDIHIIGHSLGAHCAGEVGTKIKGIGRISGLDPAEPYFEGSVEVVRLEKRDAEFVDIIHTDGSAFLNSLGMGYRSSIGHVDFYPNGGAAQPGCPASGFRKITSSIGSGISKGTTALKNTFACSHDRSIEYYIESINAKCPFTAYKCSTYDQFKAAECLACSAGMCSTMGYHSIESSARGDFYLMTNQNGASPQCSYHYSITLKAGTMTEKAFGKISVTMIDSNNSSFGPVAMTDKDIYIDARTSVTRLVIVPSSLGDIVSIQMTYEKSGNCLLGCVSYSDFIRVQKVEVIGGEDQTRTNFCGKNIGIAKDQMREFDADMLKAC